MGLRERYATMDTKELVKIITLHKDQYTPDAIQAAKDELRSRGETRETLTPILKEAKEEEQIQAQQLKASVEKPLSDTQRVFYTIFPVMAFYYLIFTPANWKKRKLEAELCWCRGMLWYIGILTLTAAILTFLNPSSDVPVLYIFTFNIIVFLCFIFAYRRARRILAEMA